mgnify:CR=1 FL=1
MIGGTLKGKCLLQTYQRLHGLLTCFESLYLKTSVLIIESFVIYREPYFFEYKTLTSLVK